MSTPAHIKKFPQDRSVIADEQARKLLRALCEFILPLVDRSATRNPYKIPMGDKAAVFINELEHFVHRKRKTRARIRIQAPYKDPLDYMQVHQSHGGISASKKDVLVSFRAREYRRQWARPCLDQFFFDRITEHMPLRLLYFRPSPRGLFISLLDRHDIYRRLLEIFPATAAMSHNADFWITQATRYAILSHTWCQKLGELTYAEWKGVDILDSSNLKCHKVVNFCKAAFENHGLSFGWIDTLCIDKESSSELDESIRSMHKWYADADICITYLAETDKISDMDADPWFTRGWTLQELIAPAVIKFYNKSWERLVLPEANDKKVPSILDSIRKATSITEDELSNIRQVSISRRMALAADRRVTREEDAAYSLMGIFDVSISTAYGEGLERAFFRLVKEIFDTTRDITDVFNWGGYSSTITSLFPSYPDAYIDRCDAVPKWTPIKPFTLTHLGLRTPILLMAAEERRWVSDSHPIGVYCGTVSCRIWGRESGWQSFEYSLLNESESDGKTLKTVGILNVETHDEKRIRLPKICFAVLLQRCRPPGKYKRVETSTPLVFNLRKKGPEQSQGNADDWDDVVEIDSEEESSVNEQEESGSEKEIADDLEKSWYVVKKSQLSAHGMRLVTLYL